MTVCTGDREEGTGYVVWGSLKNQISTGDSKNCKNLGEVSNLEKDLMNWLGFTLLGFTRARLWLCFIT